MLFGPQYARDSSNLNSSTSSLHNSSSSSLHLGSSNNLNGGVRRHRRMLKSGSSPSTHSKQTIVERSSDTFFSEIKRNTPPPSVSLPNDSTTMYPTVWKSLGFKKKVLRLSPQATEKPICVTGVDGFAASWVVAELLERGYSVRGTVQNRCDEISGISSLPNASTRLNIVEASLLTPESCDLAIQGCDYIFHTGTPSSCSVRDPLSELQEPGVHGIGSRMHCIIPMMTNFIQACSRAKVILTSSIAAMVDSVNVSDIITEECWNHVSSLERNPHFLSLKLAEEAAWQLVDQLPRENKFELIAINSGTLMGPALCSGKIPPGNQVIHDLISGKYSALVDLSWAMVDVRDNAKAHVMALENLDASGRYICVNNTVWLKDIVDVLSRNGYSGRDLPWKFGLPNWVARLPSYSTQLGQVGASLYAPTVAEDASSPYLNDKIVNQLGLKFLDIENTVVSCAADLLKWGYIKPWAEDHHAIECACCKYPFTFYRRKHHCRECGIIICSDCSLSRAVVEGLEDKQRLCDNCVRSSIPALLELLSSPKIEGRRKAVIALESLLLNVANHDLVTRSRGIPLLMAALHSDDSIIAQHGAGALLALSADVSSALQMVLEGAVLQMLEVPEGSETWRVALQALRNMWRQINRVEFRRMLNAVARVSTEAAIGPLKGNILLSFVHMMESKDIPSLLSEGLVEVLYSMLTSDETYPRAAAAHAIKHLIPSTYNPDTTIVVPPYVVDNHEELLTNAALSDLQFLVKGHIAPINAHKVVLFFRNPYFKNMFGSATSHKTTIEIDNCSHGVFCLLLCFLYTGNVQIESSNAQELLFASSFYQVQELQKRTEKFLAGEITVVNVVDLLYLADTCHADDLKRVCIDFLMKNIHDAVRLPSYFKHREWASEEVINALASICGSMWEPYYLDLVRKKRVQISPSVPTSPESVKTKQVISPAVRENVSSKGNRNNFSQTWPKEKTEKRICSLSDDLSEGVC